MNVITKKGVRVNLEGWKTITTRTRDSMNAPIRQSYEKYKQRYEDYICFTEEFKRENFLKWLDKKNYNTDFEYCNEQFKEQLKEFNEKNIVITEYILEAECGRKYTLDHDPFAEDDL